MFIRDYITKHYPIFSLNDTIEDAYETAKEFGFTHVFLQEEEVFLGAVSLDCLENYGTGFLGETKKHAEKFALLEDAQLLDAVKLFHSFSTNIIPVITPKEAYVGYIESADVFHEFAQYPLFSENGAVLTVQTQSRHYSFTEIAQIVEGSQAKLHGCFISAIGEENIQITLKMSTNNLTSIGETFERFGYTIIQKYYSDEKTELLKNRYEFFQKFIEI